MSYHYPGREGILFPYHPMLQANAHVISPVCSWKVGPRQIVHRFLRLLQNARHQLHQDVL